MGDKPVAIVMLVCSKLDERSAHSGRSDVLTLSSQEVFIADGPCEGNMTEELGKRRRHTIHYSIHIIQCSNLSNFNDLYK